MYLRVSVFPSPTSPQSQDLDAKFVILCWRDYALAKDLTFAREVFEAVCAALDHLQSRLPPISDKSEPVRPKWMALNLDKSYSVRTDGVLLKSDGGHPDNTYDIWAEEGQLVYVNGLYLTALSVSANDESAIASSWNELEAWY